MDTMRRSIHLIYRTDGISPSLPVIYKAISPSELQHLPHTASGADLFLTNNIAANGQKPTISLTANHTRTPHSRMSGFISIQTLRRKSLWFVCFWEKLAILLIIALNIQYLSVSTGRWIKINCYSW